MIQITFKQDMQRKAVCVSTDNKIKFAMNQEPFINREFRFCGESLLFDGYSVWFEGAGEGFEFPGNFSLSFFFAPYGYSSFGDGLFSLFDAAKRAGFYILLKKQGRLQVGFGNRREIFSFTSIKSHAGKAAWNIVTVVFRQDAGWCDLYVNGVLSNRKQFPRHMPLKWPDREAFLGRYVDYETYSKEVPSGRFYGLMKEVLIHKGALKTEEVKKLHETYSSGKAAERLEIDRKAYEKDVQRPEYHLIAPGKWMNEPHAPLYFEGYYHIFYQANPHGPIWDHIQWGHQISRDMVHWEDMPLALETGEGGLDPDGCWSGSALVDKEGKPRIFYTAGNNERFPNQFVAMAEARIDEEKRLPEWIKSESSVVEQTEGWFGEFRDPYVWLEDDTYFMLVGTGDAENGGGNAVLYSSEDLHDWRSHGFFLDYDYEKNQEVGHVFELPVLLPLKDENGGAACHVFLVCGCQIESGRVEIYAFLGNWDPENRSFQKFHDRALLLDLGNGAFTGPSGFVTPDGRSVVFTITQGMRKGREEFYAGWAHNGGLPVELFMRNKELCLRPVREIYQLKKNRLLCLEDVSLKEANEFLENFSGNRFWMEIRAEGRYLAVETGDGETKRSVYYDRREGRLGVLDGTGRQLGKYRGREDSVNIGNEPICMEYFLDHSMIEVYLNERRSATVRNYIQGKERKIRLEGNIQKIRRLELWEMKPAY